MQMRTRGALAALIAVAVLGPVAPAQAAPPTCDSPFQLPPLHSGSVSGSISSCSDPEGDPLSFTSITAPAHGSGGNDGPNVTYTATSNFAGTDSWIVRVADGNGGQFDVTVQAPRVNQAPVCKGVALGTVAQGQTKTAPASCTDADGDPLAYAIASPAARGTASVSGSQLSYTGRTGGNDSFTYVGTDGAQQSAPARVTASVSDTTAPTLAAVAVKGQRLARVLAKGLRIRVSTQEACRVEIVLRAGGPPARLAADVAAGTTVITMKVTPLARLALLDAHRVRVRPTVSATDASGNRTDRALTVRLQR